MNNFAPAHTANRPYDIIALDGVDMDLVMKVPRLPGHGEKEVAEFVGRLPGGPCANFACAVARLGMRVASLATVGEDVSGQEIVADFAAYGVATEFILTKPGGVSPFTVILIEPSGERSIIVVPSFASEYDDAYLQQVLAQTRAVHTMPRPGARFNRMAQIARANDVKVMIDVESSVGANRPVLEEMLGHVDIASFNERGLVASSGEAATIEGARKLLAYGPEMVLVTLGPRGSIAVTADEAHQVGGWQVDVQDTTGAGDTFNAAFLSRLLSGDSLAECLTFANAAAAIAVTGLGPRGNLPTITDVNQFLAERQQE